MKKIIEFFSRFFATRDWRKTDYIDYNSNGIFVFDSTLLENPHKKIF